MHHDEIIQTLYREMPQGLNREQRLENISHFFLEAPYLRGALGEGHGARFDQSPLFRTDAFDCLTYVNMVLALFFSRNLSEFKYKMTAINYRHSCIAYENRHHFMSVDWNKENTRLGYIHDFTQAIKDKQGRSIACLAETLIDRPNWFKFRQFNDLKINPPLEEIECLKRLQEMRLLGEKLTPEIGKVPYLPLTALFDSAQQPNWEIFKQIPQGAIVEIVRPQWDLRSVAGTFLDISHLGFAIWQADQLIFREASLRLKKVADTPLMIYLKSLLYEPTIKGINLQNFF